MKDIREYKTNLRQRYRAYRVKLTADEKSRLDEDVFQRITRLNQYATAELLLVYVSTPIEVDTRRLIEYALSQGKRVAVPRCVPNTRRMEFFEIRSLAELSPGTFGVDEPQPDPERLVPPEAGLVL